MIEPSDQLGLEIPPEGSFCFSCRPELECFNTCCRFKRLPLWPYDLLRLRRALGLSSPEILDMYVELEFDPISGWPALRLRLDGEGRCPFVTEEGCRVYPHRPAACRIYPLARAASPGKEGSPPQVRYFQQETTGCLGWENASGVTLEEWTRDQGLAQYDHFNDEMMSFFLHPRRKGRMELTPRQVHAVIAALYNLDVFRQMLPKPDLRAMFSDRRLEEAEGGDEALLLLGRDFLKARLFGDSTD